MLEDVIRIKKHNLLFGCALLQGNLATVQKCVLNKSYAEAKHIIDDIPYEISKLVEDSRKLYEADIELIEKQNIPESKDGE